jgi:hypothetical protein
MSLHIDKAADGCPVMTITPSGYKAVSMAEEVERLEGLLVKKGSNVASWVGKYPLVALCIADDGVRKKISKKCGDFDSVVTLSCDAGQKNVENILPEKKVVPAMKAKGIVNAETRKNMTMSKFFLEKDTVNLTRFSFDD